MGTAARRTTLAQPRDTTNLKKQETKKSSTQMNPVTPDRETCAATGLHLALSAHPSLTHIGQADAWEDQNAATSADADARAVPTSSTKRALNAAPNVSNCEQPQAKAQKTVEVKQIKEEETPFPNGFFGLSDAHFQVGDDIAHLHQRSDIFGKELSQGDDIADKRLQQLVQAHSKVSQLQAQLAAARQQCAQLQTESNSVAIDQGLVHAPDEWGSEDCSTADASRVAMPAASQSQGRPAQPLQQVPHSTAHNPNNRPVLKDEPVMMLHASKSAAADGTWALMDDAPAAGGAESALSSGEIPARCDTEPDEVQTKAMHADVDSDPGQTQAMQQELQGTKDVTALATLLSMTYQGKVVNLNHRIMQAPVSSSPGSTAWRTVPFWPVRAPVKGDAEEEAFCLQASSPHHVVCTVSGACTQISNGELRMASETALVFDSTCNGVVVSNMAFYGGVVVCHGSGCNVSFEDCKFARCSVVVLAGAQVSLTTSTFQNASKGVAICASGTDSVVRMHGGSIKYGSQGAFVRCGARLEASSVTITRCIDVGVECEGERSSIKLVDCDIHEFPHQKTDSGNVATGVRVHRHSAAHLATLTLSGLCHGVTVQDGATASICETTVTHTLQSSITFEGAACGTITGCTLKRSQKVCGLCVCGASTQVNISKCSFSEHAYSGVVVLKGGSLTAEACTTSLNKYEGFYVHDKGSAMTLKSCSSDRDLRGCGVQGDGAVLTVQGGTVSNSTSDGIAAWNCGAAVLKSCTVSGSRKDGVLVKGTGSRIEMHQCTVSGTHQHGGVAKGGGFLRAEGCTLQQSATGCGIRASGKGTDVEVEECTLQKNAVHAALATEEASMDVSASKSSGHKKEAFMVWSRAQLSVTDSTSEGDAGVGGVDDEGVLCMEGIKVHMEGQKREKKPGVATTAPTPPEGSEKKDKVTEQVSEQKVPEKKDSEES